MGLIPAPDLEFALDKLENEEDTLCLMGTNITWSGIDDDDRDPEPDPTDLTPYIDPVSSSSNAYNIADFTRLLLPSISTPRWISSTSVL